MAYAFEQVEDLQDYLFRIVDNGGKTADRYTVIFSDSSYLYMSKDATSPNGVATGGEFIDVALVSKEVEKGEAVDIALGDLDPNLVQLILDYADGGLDTFVEALENKEEWAVAPSRDEQPVENDGGYDTFCKAIYLKDGKFMVKMDGGPDDLGPYDNTRDVILATVPDHDALSGPEYQSELNLLRMTPDEDVAAAVKALEARRTEEWEAENAHRY